MNSYNIMWLEKNDPKTIAGGNVKKNVETCFHFGCGKSYKVTNIPVKSTNEAG